MTYLNLLGGGHLFSFIAYCLLLHMHVFMLCHCCYANKKIEKKTIMTQKIPNDLKNSYTEV